MYLTSGGVSSGVDPYGYTSDLATRLKLTTPIKIIHKPTPTEKGACLVDGQVIPLTWQTDKEWHFKYGAFPQMLASKQVASVLSDLAIRRSLPKTGNSYTFSQSSRRDTPWDCIEITREPEYQFRNRRYVHMLAKEDQNATLSNKSLIGEGFGYWIEVQPLIWAYRPNVRITYTRDAILAGLDWGTNDQNQWLPYSKSGVNNYLTAHFNTEVMQSHQFCKTRGFAPTQEEVKTNQQKAAHLYAQKCLSPRSVVSLSDHSNRITGITFSVWKRFYTLIQRAHQRES